VIKNNDHVAISWQITIHQIVQITDISQWRELLPSKPCLTAHSFLWWVGSAAVRMATAIRLHQFYGNKLFWSLPHFAPFFSLLLSLSLNRCLTRPVAAAGEWVELSWVWIRVELPKLPAAFWYLYYWGTVHDSRLKLCNSCCTSYTIKN